MFKKKLTQEETQVLQESVKDSAEVVDQGKFVLLRERGDLVKYQGQNYRIVEVIEPDRFHVKNPVEPFNSFIVLESELDKEVD